MKIIHLKDEFKGKNRNEKYKYIAKYGTKPFPILSCLTSH